LWVLLNRGETLLMPPLTAPQLARLDADLTTAPAESIIDRSNSIIARLYTLPSTLLQSGAIALTPLKATFNNEILLRGYSVDARSADRGLLQPGAVLFVTLYWQAVQPVSEDYNIAVQLWADGKNALVSTTDFPFGGAYRTRIWRPTEWVATHHWLQLPAHLPQGRYTLATTMLHLLGGKRIPATGDSVDSTIGFAVAPDFRIRPVAVPLTDSQSATVAQFADLFTVADAHLAIDSVEQPVGSIISIKPGATLELGLTWRTLTRPMRDYTTFLHVSPAPDVAPIAQTDLLMGSTIAGGSFPTGAWRPPEAYRDTLKVTVPPTLAPGRYGVWLGIYDWQSGTRLPVSPRTDADPSDQWLVATLQVLP
jgi:hypothetical protein